MDQIRPKETIRSNNEKIFVVECLKQGSRTDMRKIDDFRELKFEFLKDYGEVIVHVGKTKILAVTKAEIVKPHHTKPSEGLLYFRVNLNETGSKAFEHFQKSKDLQIEIEKIIDSSIRGSKALDLESLCVEYAKFVWKIQVELDLLDFCGNLIDAFEIAALTSLMHFRRNYVSVSEEGEVILHPFTMKNPVELMLHHFPICTTFAFFKEDIFCVDPGLSEDLLAKSYLTIAMNSKGELCLIHKPGGIQMHFKSIEECTKISERCVKNHIQYIEQMVKNNINHRRNKLLPTYNTLQYDIDKEGAHDYLDVDMEEKKKFEDDDDISVSESEDEDEEDIYQGADDSLKPPEKVSMPVKTVNLSGKKKKEKIKKGKKIKKLTGKKGRMIISDDDDLSAALKKR